MKNIISIIIVITLLSSFFQSCSRKAGCNSGMPRVLVRYVDKNGNDLFTNGQNGYNMDSTYFKDVYGNFISNATSYFVGWASSTMLLGPYNNSASNQYSTIVVHLKTGIDDTLKRHLTAGGCTQLDSIWYNGQLKKIGDQVINGVTNPDLYTTQFEVVH